MKTYVILMRGINVGGKNKVPMTSLKACLEQLGLANVTTYIASGNIIADSDQPAEMIRAEIETALPTRFQLDSEIIRVLVLTPAQLQAVIDHKPAGFGEQPSAYHSDVIFLMGLDPVLALTLFRPRAGVDQVWAGKDVIYWQRLSAQRTKSRLSNIMSSPTYKAMTIRNWNTTTALLKLCRTQEA